MSSRRSNLFLVLLIVLALVYYLVSVIVALWKITKGLDVLDKMEGLAGPGDGPPTQQILLISARRK